MCWCSVLSSRWLEDAPLAAVAALSLWVRLSALHIWTLELFSILLCKPAQALSGHVGMVSEQPFSAAHSSWTVVWALTLTPNTQTVLFSFCAEFWLHAWGHCLAGEQGFSQVTVVLHTVPGFPPGLNVAVLV